MRAVIQRVSEASVKVEGSVISAIGHGLLILLGVEEGDNLDDSGFIAKKISQMRIFPDHEDKLNLSVQDISGEIMVISQFTLISDCKKGNRPSFSQALSPSQAEMFYNDLVQKLKKQGLVVKTGKFRADMKISLTNDGPVTIFLDSRKRI